MAVDREVLVQYISLKAEILDMETLIRKIRNEISRMESSEQQVSDIVKGTRRDGTYGSIRITGYPYALCERKREVMRKREAELDCFRERLLEMVNDVDSYINTLDDSRMRRMIRYKYMEELSWVQVAHRMGGNYTADSCRNSVDRFFGKR